MRALAIILAGVVVFGQTPEDKTKNLKGKQILDKTLAETGKQKGFKFSESVSGAGQNITADGICKSPDYCESTVSSDKLYYKGDKLLVLRTDGKIVTPKEITDRTEQGQVALARNPIDAINDIKADAGGFKDEKFDGAPNPMDGCVLVSIRCSDAQIKKQLNDIVKNVELPPQAKNVNIESFVDMKETKSIYHIHVAKDTLLIKKIEWQFTPKVKLPGGYPDPRGGGGNPPSPIDPSQLNSSMTIDIASYNEGLDSEIPKEIKVRLGLK